MGLAGTLARIPRILEANFNTLLDKSEDPEKMIDQLLIEYKRDLIDVKRDTASVMADVKMAETRLADCDASIARKQTAAENALKAGNEEDARALLAAKQKLETSREGLLQDVSVARQNAQMMEEGYRKLVRNIEELERRKNAAKAKMSMAKAQDRLNRTVAGSADAANMAVFNRYEQNAERMYEEANAAARLASGNSYLDDLTEKYTQSAEAAAVDEELAALKNKLGLE